MTDQILQYVVYAWEVIAGVFIIWAFYELLTGSWIETPRYRKSWWQRQSPYPDKCFDCKEPSCSGCAIWLQRLLSDPKPRD